MHFRKESIYIHHKQWKPVYDKAMISVIKLSKEEKKLNDTITELEIKLGNLNKQNNNCTETLTTHETTIRKNKNELTTCTTNKSTKETHVHQLTT